MLNDPVNLVDPEGKFGIAAGILAGAGAGLVVGIVDAALNGNKCDWFKIILTDVATGAIAGALGSGAGMLGALAGEVGGIALNALSGLIGTAPSSSCDNPPPEGDACK